MRIFLAIMLLPPLAFALGFLPTVFVLSTLEGVCR